MNHGQLQHDRSSGLLRRDPTEEAESSPASLRAIFNSFDGDNDGIATFLEIEHSFNTAKQAIPEDLHDILGKMDTNKDKALSFAEVSEAADHAGKNLLGRLHTALDGEGREATAAEKDLINHASKKHSKTSHQQTVGVKQHEQVQEAAPGDGSDDSWVTCGGHRAPSCDACPSTDSSGRTVFDHGSEWCHGDCIYHDQKCRKSGTVDVAGIEAGKVLGYATTPVPNLLNPKITKEDERTIDNAAEAAIREENMEGAQQQVAQEEALNNKKFSWNKFWLTACITVSVILGVCACVSACALCVYVFAPSRGPAKGEEDMDSDADGETKAADGDKAAPPPEDVPTGEAAAQPEM